MHNDLRLFDQLLTIIHKINVSLFLKNIIESQINRNLSVIVLETVIKVIVWYI